MQQRDSHDEHDRPSGLESGADIGGRNLSETGEKDPEPDDFAPIDADEIRDNDRRCNADRDCGARFGQALQSALAPNHAVEQLAHEQNRRTQTDGEEKIVEIATNPRAVRPERVVVELDRIPRQRPNR